jgi:hypothetical protein
MKTKIREGQFEVIDSFAMKKRNKFNLIGQMKKEIQKDWFLNIPLNAGFQ